jgi:cyclohexyl-isocyanide hydratase
MCSITHKLLNQGTITVNQPLTSDADPELLGDGFAALRSKPLEIGMLIYPSMEQIDFTGPFEVLARIPNAAVHVIGTQAGPFRDCLGLMLTPEIAIDDAQHLDLLHVPGGPGQEALMQNEPVLAFIRDHVAAGKPLFSVCTGALICGAAGVLQGRRATTHWSAHSLLPYFGAIPVEERFFVDGNLVSTAGVTAGIDGALTIASLLRGDDAARRIQLEIEYAPDPPFHAGTPETAPPDLVATVQAGFRALSDRRLATARDVAARLGLPAGTEGRKGA